MSLLKYASLVVARAAALSAVALLIGHRVLLGLPAHVTLHLEPTFSLPGLDSPLELLAMVFVVCALISWIGWANDVVLWSWASPCFLAGAVANMGSFALYGGVPDFIPILHFLEQGPLLLSLGDVAITAGWTCLMLGAFKTCRRDDGYNGQDGLRLRRPRAGEQTAL